MQALLGDDPSLAPLTQLLIERTEGNPFFLEESVRTLVETGGLVGEPGSIAWCGRCRRCRCQPRCRRCWRHASTAYRQRTNASSRPPRSSAPRYRCPCCRPSPSCPSRPAQHSLAALQAAEFLYETRLFPEPEYTFKHALTHEVAYRSLVQERRRALHTRLIEVIEGLSTDRLADQVERLAHRARARSGTKP